MKNAFLIRWLDGYTEVVDAASIAATDRLEDLVAMGNASIEDATRAVTARLSQLVAPERITVAIEPAGGDSPYVDWDLGDDVTVPDHTGAPVARRVLGITVSEDPEGNPFFIPELG